MSKGLQIAVAALAVAILVGWYASTTLQGGATYRYFQTLDEFRASAPAGVPVRVHGYVSPGSIERDVPGKTVRFRVQTAPPHASAPPTAEASAATGDAVPSLAVVYSTLELPDMFKDGAEVVVEGQAEGSGDAAVFHATNVLAKCPSKFQAKTQTPASM
jgi:cytochrome c-type biogenesis protein CcmE